MGKSKREGAEVNFTIELIRTAVKKSETLTGILLPSVVDPLAITGESVIYGIVLNPPDDNAKDVPSSIVYPAIRTVIVDTIQTRVKPGYVVINGTIDLPKEDKGFSNLEDAYFEDEEDARNICRTIADVEIERSLDKEKTQKLTTDFLVELRKKDRW
jgi:hypothetical protein